MSSIDVEHLSKSFVRKTKTKGSGRLGLFGYTLKEEVPAVKDISFTIQPGERVAFIGPNGAGKSTTLKILSGIMHPTSGTAKVAGLVPWEHRQKLAYKIGLVFGQRTQLWHHLPVRNSFELLAKIYDLSPQIYDEQLTWLKSIFDIAPLLEMPVRSLSLGQRMRAEIAASLLHKPAVLFLDEPTIGLDVTTKAELRDHLRKLSLQSGTTIMLTSHDTADIEQITDRVILINHGEKLIDTDIQTIKQQYLNRKVITILTAEEHPSINMPNGATVRTALHRLDIEVEPDANALQEIIGTALKSLTVRDITISDTPLEEVIKHIYHTAKR